MNKPGFANQISWILLGGRPHDETVLGSRASRQRVECGAGILIAATAILFYFWRCHFGVDLVDEPAYLAPGLSLFPQGDIPFIDEMFMGPRHSHILNFWILRPLLGAGFTFLSARLLAVGLYAGLLLLFTLLCFRRQWGVTSALAFSAVLLYDPFLMPTWSHNWWLRDLLLLHAIFALLSRPLLAGIAYGLAVIAYFPIALIAPLLFLWHRHRRFLGAFAVTLIFYSIYLVQKGWAPAWLHSLSATHHLAPYQGIVSFSRFSSPVLALAQSRELWVFLSAGLVLPRVGDKRIRATLMAGVCVWIFRRLFQMVSIEPSHTLYLGMGLAAGLILRNLYRWLALSTIGGAWIMAIASISGPLALFWLVPLLWIPFAAQTRQQRISPLFHSLSLVLMLGAAVSVQWRGRFGDARLKELNSVIKTGPWRGISTTDRRRFLVEKLGEILDSHHGEFAFITPMLPAAFASGLRPSLNTIFEDSQVPAQFRELSALRLLHRTPTFVIEPKTHPWTWGAGHQPLPQTPDPLSTIAHCLRSTPLLNEPELAIHSVDPDRIEFCLSTNQG
ncbi:MAG: hypothetical protein HYZ71_14690 [Deltaproteobacteria bacterium]|nr:hypothetical protein [Deltaproteobacteria bacterium]